MTSAPQVLPEGTAPRHAAGPHRGTLFAAGTLVAVAWATAIWFAPYFELDGWVRRMVLFGHLASLVLGFGAVLTVDWFGFLWAVRQRSMLAVLQIAHGAHTLVWLGLTGLLVTGMLLSPDLSAGLTVLKLLAVLGVGLNGLRVVGVQRRIANLGDRPPPTDLLRQGAGTVLVSQLCWWTAMAIGFLNGQG